MTEWYSAIVRVFVSAAARPGAPISQEYRPGECGGDVRVLERNHQREALTRSRKRAHFAGFRRVSHGTFVGQKSKVGGGCAGRPQSFARIVYKGACVTP